MYGCFAYMYVHVPHTYMTGTWIPWETEEGIVFPEIGVTESCEPVLGLEHRSSGKHLVLLTTGPFL